VTRALLILPTATYRAPEFLDAARRLSVEVVTGSERPQALAEIMGDRFIELPLDDPERAADAIVELAARVPLDAVLAVDDQGALAAAHAAERLGLVHNAPDAVAATRDKAVMRKRLGAAGVAQPAYAVVEAAPAGGRADRVTEAARRLGYPVVIKPVSLSGSRGVIRADDDVQATAATGRIEALLERIGEPGTALLVESFVTGPEFALEGLLSSGRLEVLTLFDKPDPLDGPFFEETIYLTPSALAPEAQGAISDLVSDAAAAIGLAEGPVHAEVRLSPRDGTAGRPVLIEVAARTIGGRCASALRFSTGVTLEEIVLAHALGRVGELDTTRGDGASGVMMLPIPRSGILVGVGGRERALEVPFVRALDITVAPRHRVEALPEGDRYLGFLFAEAPTGAEVDAALREGHRRLEVEIEPAGADESLALRSRR